jgi:hypothetical protein
MDDATLRRWMTRRWFFGTWCVVAAFGTYAAMYGFRKPFTVGMYGGADAKAWLVTAQVVGYMLSKVIGIKVIAEMQATHRAVSLLGTVAVAQLALLLFAVTPAPFNAVWMFVNGLALGLVFGLVLGFVEGRCQTEVFVAGLCASFILADGAAKSVGAMVLARGIPEPWMPGVAGLIFSVPLVGFVWMLTRIPAPSIRDEAERAPRQPMSAAQRLVMRHALGAGLVGIVLAYLQITMLRSLRADFAPEIWAGLGLAGQPALFTVSELWVTLAVVAVNGSLVLVRDNRRAFIGGLGLSVAGLGLALGALVGQRLGLLPPFAFMVLLGVGMYVPYVAVHTTLFERLIALTRERGNIGYLMYLADAVGYLGYAAIMVSRALLPQRDEFLDFFTHLAGGLLLVALVALLFAGAAYAQSTTYQVSRSS